MKKQRLKTYLKLGILLFGISAFIIACQNDETGALEHDYSSKRTQFSTIDFSTFKTKIQTKDISNSDINGLVSTQTVPIGELQYTTQSESQNFVTSIDSTDVLMAEKNGITSYTFKTQTTDMSKTTNYVLAHDDENVEEFYITYEDDGSGKIIDPTSGFEVTTQSMGSSIWCPFAQVVQVCADCGSTGCNFEIWGSVTEIVIHYEPCSTWNPGGGNPGDGSGPGNGDGESSGGNTGDGTTGGNDLPIDGPITTKPLELENEEEIIRKRECKKIKKIIDDFNPDFMTKLRDLKNKDDLNFESGVAVFEDDTVQEYQGSEEESTIQNYPVAPTSDYIAVGHVHNENDVKPPTYSVFSLQDLEWVARKYERGYLNTSKFVTFLATADGNYLALTINSASKFWEFFRYIDAAYPNATVQERQEAAVKLNEVSDILDKYYKSRTNPLIKENAQGTTNNRYQLRYFMQFLEEADAGITVFETNENFDSFSELVLNGTNVVGNETPCEL